MTAKTKDEQVVPISKLWWVGLLAVVAAAIPNLVYFWITKNVFDIPYLIARGGTGPMLPLPWFMIILFILVPTISATILLAILGKLVSRPFLVFWIISGVVLVLSFIPTFSLPSNIVNSTKIGLGLMHVIAAPIVVGVLSTLGRKK
ncbi:MAG: DUF6069 family protein [Anaerolineae bacterium]|nr:DUF6069 family protein [Anaerolineae bacterium]MDK1081956.1 DUF6069 family protein [Anaerolineae bacterium]